MNSPRSSLARGIAAGAAALAAMVLSVGPAAASGSGSVPFTDPSQQGLITLCNQAGQAMTSGSMTSTPFAWEAISSAVAPAGYRKHGLATLFAYQPIKYVAPGDWSGDQLTGSTFFHNPKHPLAVATAVDEPLDAITSAYPPHWDGLVQLRLIYTAPNTEEYPGGYPTAIIKVSGNNWTLVQGGTTACNAGRGVSVETLTLRKGQLKAKATASPSPGSSSSPGPGSSSGSSSGGSSAATGSGGSGSGTEPTADGVSASSSSGLGTGAKAAIGLGVLALLALAGTAVAMRRRANG